MSSTTILFGNGLGMSIDPEYFTINKAVESVWATLDDKNKEILKLDIQGQPKTEDELERHHQIADACETLTKYNYMNIEFLGEHGSKFPTVFRDFVFKVAMYFFENQYILPPQFVDNLVQFYYSQEYCNIVTLNYDKLLYQGLWNHGLLHGYQPKGLVDGVLDSGFEAENLVETWHKFSLYLHLHGSPIFYDRDGRILKSEYNKVDKNEPQNKAHIVLAHPGQKSKVISRSTLLKTYDTFFEICLGKSDRFIVFGYGGKDEHINERIKYWIKQRNKESLHIVDFARQNNAKDRNSFWMLTIPGIKNENIHLVENILEFDFFSLS